VQKNSLKRIDCKVCAFTCPVPLDENYFFYLVWGRIKHCRNSNGLIEFASVKVIADILKYQLSEEDLRKITILENILSEYKVNKNEDKHFSFFLKKRAFKNVK